MNLCTMCGSEISESDIFCGVCGAKIKNGSNGPMSTQYAINPTSIQLKLGIVYYKQNKYGEALKVFRNVLKEDPENSYVKKLFKKAQMAQKDELLD